VQGHSQGTAQGGIPEATGEGCCWAQALHPVPDHPSTEKGLAGHRHGREPALKTRTPCLPLQPHPTRDQALPSPQDWGVMSTPAPAAGPPSRGQIRQRAGRIPPNSLCPPGSGPAPCPAPTLTFPLGPSRSRQVAKMCWGGPGAGGELRHQLQPDAAAGPRHQDAPSQRGHLCARW